MTAIERLRGGCRTHAGYVLLLLVSPFLLYFPVLGSRTFGPEFALFYFWMHGRGLRETLMHYAYLDQGWYRPTSFALPYWLGQQFFDWHVLAGWRVLEVLTVAASALVIYWFVQVLVPRARMAAALAAIYFALHPALYAFVFETAPFDLMHVIFGVLAIGLFLRGWQNGESAHPVYVTASAFCFTIALTSKEVSLAIPIYLGASVLFLRRGNWKSRLCSLLPHLTIGGVYYLVHLRQAFGKFAATAYREQLDVDAVLANLYNFPLWIVRVYYRAGRGNLNGTTYDSFANNAIGIVLLVFVAVALLTLRHREGHRRALWLMLAWTVVFLALPVYSGGFLWHVTFPAIGYCVLFGLACEAWFEAIPRKALRAGAVALLLAGLLALSSINLRTELASGYHSPALRINSTLLDHPPLPPGKLGTAPLIYIEDRLQLGGWSYGCFQHLFNYVYLRHDIHEVVVPPMASVPRDLRERWLHHPNAFFFRYDDEYHWRDASNEFRQNLDSPVVPARTPAREADPYLSGSGNVWDILTGRKPGSQGYQELMAALLAAALAWQASRRGSTVFRTADRVLTSFAAHPRRVILLAGLVPLIARLLILPALPIPQPHIADEFGHLLIADTFNAGRLANPPHPFQAHFEACYTLLQPAYASIYPVAQGAVLGLAEFFHVNPWFGVWLSIGLMCMSIAWMLQQWLPPKWAVFGTALVILRLGVMSHWMNSFWGGAMAATGGALAFGAYRRLTRRPNVRDTLLLGLGIAILAQSRPYEGAILTAIVLIAWGWNLVRRRTPDWQARVRFTVLPLAACLVVIAAWTGYYDWRVTGNPLILPYKWYQTLYAMPQSFVIQPPLPPTPAVHHQPEIAANYAWQREAYDKAASWAGYIGVTKDKVRTLWRFYLEVSLSIPLAIFGWWMLRERRLRLLMLATAAVFAAMTLYPMCFPHYAAPLTAAIFALAVQGMRHLHVWKRRTTAFGAAFVWTLFCVRLVMVPIPAGAEDLPPAVVEKFAPRTETAAILHQLGGTHIVFVRYRSGHNIHTGVIFNDADIDGSPVIWARELDEASNRAFMAHYPERTVWLLEADTVPRTLQRYVLPDTASQPTPSPVR